MPFDIKVLGAALLIFAPVIVFIIIIVCLPSCSVDSGAIGGGYRFESESDSAIGMPSAGIGGIENVIETSIVETERDSSTAGGDAGNPVEPTGGVDAGGTMVVTAGFGGYTAGGSGGVGGSAGVVGGTGGSGGFDGSAGGFTAGSGGIGGNVGDTCDLPEDTPFDCHSWQCEDGASVEVIDDTDSQPWNRYHPQWPDPSPTKPNCRYVDCLDGEVSTLNRPECYRDYEETWGTGVCFWCFQSTAYTFDCSDPNASSAWKNVCP